MVMRKVKIPFKTLDETIRGVKKKKKEGKNYQNLVGIIINYNFVHFH